MQRENTFDLIVVGGGTAGAICAIAAAREGLNVAVIERLACLGGMATASGLTEMNAAGFGGKPLYRGLEREIFDTLIATGHAEYHFGVPMSSNRNVKIDRLRYDPEILKILLERLAINAGVTIYYETEPIGAEEAESEVTLTLRSGFTRTDIAGKYLADATGNASAVRLLGGPTEAADEKDRMIATLMFRLSGIVPEELNDYLAGGAITETIRKGREAGVLKGGILAFTPIPGTRDYSLNVTRAKFDHEKPLDAARGMVEMRSQILPILDFVRKEVSGAANAYITSISPIAGVRDARRIVGEYCLTIEDLESMTRFDDTVAVGCYPMDFHDPVTGSVIWKVLPGVYDIPYRCLIPRGLNRAIAVGKCLCAQQKAFAAVRVMPIMMNVGESAGYACALAHSRGYTLPALPASELSETLARKYSPKNL